jgi:hypothetical protein
VLTVAQVWEKVLALPLVKLPLLERFLFLIWVQLFQLQTQQSK